jgi:hypothetical protein
MSNVHAYGLLAKCQYITSRKGIPSAYMSCYSCMWAHRGTAWYGLETEAGCARGPRMPPSEKKRDP